MLYVHIYICISITTIKEINDQLLLKMRIILNSFINLSLAFHRYEFMY